jgi:hypothetical protein
MHLRRRIFLSSLVLAVAAISPAATLGATNGTDRPLKGTSTGSLTASLVTGAATTTFAGQLSHLGAISGGDVVTFIPTGPATFIYAGTSALEAANGDELFSTVTGSGTFTSSTTAESTQVNTITGGTGRFADASGTYSETVSSVIVSIIGTTENAHNTATFNGRISY